MKPGLSNIATGFLTGFSWSSYWAKQSEVIFFGEVSKIVDGKLYNQKPGATDYLSITGVLGSYTFQCPNTAPYIAADTDYIWFKTDTTQRTTTEAELIGYDFTRTIVKYDNTSPYALRWIMILSDDFETVRENKMRDSFDLSVWWSNVLSSHGYLKQNKPIAGQYIWTPETIVDADGNVYTPVKIGSQWWLVENLKTTKYNDASAIPTGLSNANWLLEDGTPGHDGAFAQVNGSAANKADYGLTYNWWAVANAKGIAPAGYHIPTLTEINTLITTLGGAGVAGGKMKNTGTTYWNAPNTGADDTAGFYARGTGHRSGTTGGYVNFKTYNSLWMSTVTGANGDRCYMDNASDDLVIAAVDKKWGCSVRCIKN